MSALALTEVETCALLAVARLGDSAYGVTIAEDIAASSGRRVSLAAVYAALDRLHDAGLIAPWLSAPRPERGGRARRYYSLTESGHGWLVGERERARRLWRDVTLTRALSRLSRQGAHGGRR